jgi:radical SAM protein with 4Fe4S-binding SPASM domain
VWYNTVMTYQRLYIEITNVCNLNCPFCLETSREPRFMSLQEFDHVLSEIKDQGDHLYLHIKGEPTLHPQFKQILDLAHQHHKKVHLVTNGTRLDQLEFDLTDHPALSSLAISMHSIQTLSDTNKTVYLKMLENLIMRSENKPFSLYLRVWNENNIEILDWLRSILKIDFEYSPSKHRILIRKNLALDFDKEFLWPSLKHPFVSSEGHCYGGLKMMGILADGTLTPCCLDNDGDMALGNLFVTPLKTLITQDRYRHFVDHMNGNRFSEDLCQHCTYHLKHKK